MAVVQTATNEYTFYLDNNVSNYSDLSSTSIIETNENTIVTLIKSDLTTISVPIPITSIIVFGSNSGDEAKNYMSLSFIPIVIKYGYSFTENGISIDANKWYYIDTDQDNKVSTAFEVIGLTITNCSLPEDIGNIKSLNDLLTPYIGAKTSLAITQLAPFLTNIANAIRTKKGTTETINAQNFASEIESIESGGSSNWTEEQGYNGSINFTIRYTDVYIMSFEGTPSWLHYSTYDANQTINYDNAKMILIYVDIPNMISTTNLNNIEILSTNNHSYIILKPTGANFSCNIDIEGP